MAGTYLTPCTVSATSAFLVQPETCIQVGTSRLYGALETTSWTYATYGISIGLAAGQSFQLGILADLTFSHKPEYEAIESYNVGDDSLYTVTGEETTLTVEIRQFDPRILELAVGTGSAITLGDEKVIPFGGGCNMLRRPYSLQFTNESCFAPTSQDVALGVTGGATTLYDCFIQSGLEWAMAAKESNTIPLEMQALPVLERTRGMRLGCLYLY